MTTVWVYMVAPNGTVHVADSVLPQSSKTICGVLIGAEWTMGDETVSGIVATCRRCVASLTRKT